jgi:hypothetical protein
MRLSSASIKAHVANESRSFAGTSASKRFSTDGGRLMVIGGTA